MFQQLARKRRSIRSFTAQPVTEEQETALLAAMLEAPRSRNLRHREFITVRNRETLGKLAAAKHGAALLNSATFAVVCCGAPSLNDAWIEDASVAADHLLLAATDLGLGGCWVQIRNRNHDDSTASEQYVRSLLDIPDEISVECIIGIGHPAEQIAPRPEGELEYDKIHVEQFGNQQHAR